MALPETSTELSAAKPARHPPDLDFYYRIDTVPRLRAIREESVFKPRRWDLNENRWPHASLLASLDGKQHNEGVFRISFWINEQEGRSAQELFDMSNPHLLLRVRRSEVAAALRNWHIEEDDHLVGRADLIWAVCPAEGEDSFYSGGIPLDAFEVWVDGTGWERWCTAKPLQPERVRMASIGWSSVATTNGRSEPIICHWQLVPSPTSFRERGLWCLCMVDEECGWSLGGDAKGVGNVMDVLLDGPLAAVESAIAGVLTVYVGEDRLWIEQYQLGHRRVPGEGVLRTVAEHVGLLACRVERFIEPKYIISGREEMALIRASGLRLAHIRRHSVWYVPPI